jgi:hypothetical protein
MVYHELFVPPFREVKGAIVRMTDKVILENRREKDRIRRAETRRLYILMFGSTRLLRGPERRISRLLYNAKQRKVSL